MGTATPQEFMATLEHARRDDIDVLRGAIASIDPGVVEKVKWNAPSFGFGDHHRVTLRLQPRDCLEIVLHRGVATRTDNFDFTDTTGLVEWRTPDRGIVKIVDRAMLDSRLAEIVSLVRSWLEATRD